MKGPNLPSWFAGSLLAALLVGAVVAPDVPHFGADSFYYLKMARGEMGEVMKPFSNRVLEPLLAGRLAEVAGMGVEAAFLAIGGAALLGLCAGIGFLNRDVKARWFDGFSLPVILLVNPVLVCFSRDYVLPDLLHATMVVWFIVCLRASENHAGVLVWSLIAIGFAALQMQRDSTLALAAAFIVIAVLRGDRGRAAGAAVGTVLGMGLVHRLAKDSMGNIHGLGNFTYVMLKAPYNFFKNVLGFDVWTDTIARMQPDVAPPIWTWHVPSWLPLGTIKLIGVAQWSAEAPLANLGLMAACFGVLPAMILMLRPWERSRWRGWMRDRPFWLVLAAVYGGGALLIAPVLGASVYRYVGYGWPLAWVAAARLFRESFRARRQQVVLLVLLHLAASWVPGAHQSMGVGAALGLRLGLILALQFVAWHVFCRLHRVNSAAFAKPAPPAVGQV